MKNNFYFLAIFLSVLAWNNEVFASGKSVYDTNCLMCHGKNGEGDGPVGIALKPSPANYKKVFKAYKSPAELKKHILNILESGKNAMPSFKTLTKTDKADVSDYLISKYQP